MIQKTYASPYMITRKKKLMHFLKAFKIFLIFKNIKKFYINIIFRTKKRDTFALLLRYNRDSKLYKERTLKRMSYQNVRIYKKRKR